MKPSRAIQQWFGCAAAAFIAVTAMVAHGAQAQVPKTIHILVPFPAGGPTDITARVLAEQIGKQHDVSFVIENRLGGGGSIASEAAARAAPDGGTLLIVAAGVLINPLLKKTNYDPLTSFTPLCLLVRSPHVIVVNKDSPIQSFAGFLAQARAKPGELTFATVGPATGPHIAFEMLKRRANVDITFVPFNGTTPAINAVMGGHVSVAMGDFRDVYGALQSGTLRGLATTAAQRLEQLPDLPTVAEQGFPGYEAESWFGIVAPAATPKDAVSQLDAWFQEALRDPEARSKLVRAGVFPTGVCGVDFAAHLRHQNEEFAKTIRDANIKAE
ncbi:Bug family tripartite tricarboxylate transporter substrate binding protein [Rhodoplanes sp. Z2-YC6860]|uniref:Bug family tripartite tricarboxylate transporter substrate binding protein n=1 Tax=Rhodoplanes sp. Z2-YC6860 TaxID=674703 RepID=UPI00078E88EE|nr:tripartite tricarboxylate transporter substrate binding protein [Rhodoplanes sp. Z2-YC6860]AMN44910.1 extra-cytoplasmic solute receptor [Rhodoplanes sp. Z2-YC6860]